jgi:YidC/Oxa1 family membrane protein insertase
MDVKRISLFFLLSWVCFALWDAWQKDFPPQVQPQSISQSSDIPLTALPAETIAQNNDVAATTSNSIATGTLVHVHTDVLDIDINTLGGDIISAKLPAYPVSISKKDQPVQLISNDPEKLYLAQSGWLTKLQAKPEILLFKTKQTNYQLLPTDNELRVTFTTQNAQGLVINKTYTFKHNDYAIGVDYDINNLSNQVRQGQLYAFLKRKEVASKSGFLNFSNTYQGAAISSQAKPYEKISFKDMGKESLERTVQGGWVAMLEHYFLSAWIPDAQQDYRFYSRADNGLYTIGLLSPQQQLQPGQVFHIGSKLYVGPELTDRLKALAPHLDLTVDYGWLWFISIAIFKLMKWIHSIVGNWGWSIVLVTVFIKLLFYRLSATSYKSMADMRRLQPRIVDLKERYGDDRQKLSQATMELYKKEKINPLGGCLPILVQIPVFLGLYWVLIESVELRQAPFIAWIYDLSVKDPFYVLPLLMGLTMFIQQRLNPAPPDPVQAKVMMFLPVVFTVLFLNFPAGLVLYWVVNNVLSILQQWWIGKRLEQRHAKAV